jgi:hypothetical protein
MMLLTWQSVFLKHTLDIDAYIQLVDQFLVGPPLPTSYGSLCSGLQQC